MDRATQRANVGFGMLRSSLPARTEPGRAVLQDTLAELLPQQPADAPSLRAHHLPLSTLRPRQPDGRVLLVGDAASLINPLTGEGIYYAVLSGRLAGDGRGDPRRSGRRGRLPTVASTRTGPASGHHVTSVTAVAFT